MATPCAAAACQRRSNTFPRIPTSIGTCGRCSSDADQHGETVEIAFSNQAVLMQLPFLMVSVGSLHISEVSTPAYRAISTAPPKIQLSPPVPPIPQQSPLWCQISDTQLPSLPNVARCQSRSFLARILCGELGFECFHMCPHSVQVHKFTFILWQ